MYEEACKIHVLDEAILAGGTKKHKLRDHPGMVFAQPLLLDRIESPMRQLSRSSVCEPILHPFPPSLRHRLSTGELPAIPSHHPIIFILLISPENGRFGCIFAFIQQTIARWLLRSSFGPAGSQVASWCKAWSWKSKQIHDPASLRTFGKPPRAICSSNG